MGCRVPIHKSKKYSSLSHLLHTYIPRAGKLDNIKMNKPNALASKYIRTTPPKHVLSRLTLNDKHSFKILLFKFISNEPLFRHARHYGQGVLSGP